MVASVIQEIQKAQKSYYNFPKNLTIMSYLNYGILVKDEEEIYQLSKKCESSNNDSSVPIQLRKKSSKGKKFPRKVYERLKEF